MPCGRTHSFSIFHFQFFFCLSIQLRPYAAARYTPALDENVRLIRGILSCVDVSEPLPLSHRHGWG